MWLCLLYGLYGLFLVYFFIFPDLEGKRHLEGQTLVVFVFKSRVIITVVSMCRGLYLFRVTRLTKSSFIKSIDSKLTFLLKSSRLDMILAGILLTTVIRLVNDVALGMIPV